MGAAGGLWLPLTAVRRVVLHMDVVGMQEGGESDAE